MATVALRPCNRCKEMLPAENFFKMKASSDGLQYTCKTCQQKYRKEVRDPDGSRARQVSAAWKINAKTKDPVAYALRMRNDNLMKNYGITIEQYDEMLEAQLGLCAICNLPERGLRKCGTPRNLSVDHCHDNGHVRGLLCASCNAGLGLAQEDVQIPKNMIEYLEGDEHRNRR